MNNENTAAVVSDVVIDTVKTQSAGKVKKSELIFTKHIRYDVDMLNKELNRIACWMGTVKQKLKDKGLLKTVTDDTGDSYELALRISKIAYEAGLLSTEEVKTWKSFAILIGSGSQSPLSLILTHDIRKAKGKFKA